MQTRSARAQRARRTVVVDELVLQRARVAQLLADAAGLSVVHDCATMGQFLDWLRESDHIRWPHLLVLHLPAGSDSLERIDVLSALRDAGMRVLVLCSPASPAIARRLTAIGVDALVSTADREEDLVLAAKTVLTGGTFIAPLAQATIRGRQNGPRLSMQEERVLTLYATGMTIGEVADAMGIRHDTARKYLNRVRDKYTAAGRPARSKLELARIAWADGLIDPLP